MLLAGAGGVVARGGRAAGPGADRADDPGGCRLREAGHADVPHPQRGLLPDGYGDIRNRPLVERTITMTCVSNEVGGTCVSTANFIGVDLADMLEEAGVRPGAEQLFSSSVDGWTSGSPVAAAMDRGRGFPARLVIPGLYGYVSATKWVADLEVTTWQARQAYWLKRGWSREAPIKTESRIDTPKGSKPCPAERCASPGSRGCSTPESTASKCGSTTARGAKPCCRSK
ncbi:hypothetical protein Amsp01_003730 [Amycolatopsis sp. NBRC 101858]|nr:hypothetical protein Amsp01_003730 [Amycolatopsis sp. NBRC 101858]